MATHKKPANGARRPRRCAAGRCAPTFRRRPKRCSWTSGYAYEAPEEAEARFKGEAEGYTYSRYANRPFRCSKHAWRRWKAHPAPRHGQRHGGGDRDVPVHAAPGRSFCRGESNVRRLPLCDRRDSAPFGIRIRWSTVPMWTSGRVQ